ncbi:MAG TPA: hypothetical protein VK983_03075 [Candidatus Limnocylindrales bacterium]|nr:hypothetical protein [Candidatus Limnocylindrales bacterium]
MLLGIAVTVWYTTRGTQECLDDGRICLSYDSDWKKEDIISNDLDKYILLRLQRGNPKGEFQITAQPGQANVAEQAFQKSITDKLNEELDGFRLVSSSVIRIDDSQAASFTYQYRYQNSQNKQVDNQQQLIIWPASDRVYYMTAQADPDNFEKITNATDRIISSLQQVKR